MKTLKNNFWLERVQPQPASLDYPISFLQKKKKNLNSCHLNKQFLNSSYIFSPNLHIFFMNGVNNTNWHFVFKFSFWKKYIYACQ